VKWPLPARLKLWWRRREEAAPFIVLNLSYLNIFKPLNSVVKVWPAAL
jgi:hypothetical protein